MKKLFRLVLIMAWLSGWSARKEIAIPAVSSEQTDINVEVTITYDSQMKSDFADIRFADSDGGTELYHFRDNYTENTSALFVVKIPVVPIAGKTIYLYFGNASAETASDGVNTFPFFDDFSGDLSKWTVNGPVGKIYISGGSVVLFMNVGSEVRITSPDNYGSGYGWGCRLCSTGGNDNAPLRQFGWYDVGSSLFRAYYIKGNAATSFRSTDAITESTAATNIGYSGAWHNVRCHRISNTLRRFYMDNNLEATHTGVVDETDLRLRFELYSTAYPDAYMYVDFAYITKFPQDGTDFDILTPSAVTTYAGKLWRASKLAYQPNGETWGTASVPGENDEVKAVSFGPLLQVQDVIPDPCSGWIFHTYFIMARKHVRPEIKIPLRYSGRFWSFVAQLMGSDSVSGSDPYTHLMTLIEAIDGANLYGTLAASFGTVATGIVEWPSFKPAGFSIFGPDDGGFMSLAVKGIGDRIETDGGAATTYANMTAVTHIQQSSALPLRVPFGGLRLRMNDQSGVALSSSDYVKVKRVAFDFERTFAEEFCSRASQSRQWETDEPIEDGIPDTKMTLLLPDLETSRLKTHADGTLKKADLYFQLNDNYDVLIELPSLQPIPAPVSRKGQGRTSHEIAFAAARAVSNPTGMAFADWRLTLRDGWGTSYIATT